MLQESLHSIPALSSLFLSTCILYILAQTAYNLLLHPLRKYPGPILWRICRLPLDYHKYHGTTDRRVLEIHTQYGPSVRVAPNELSFTSSQAIKDIYAHATKKEEFRKDPLNQQLPPNGIPNILGANKENHVRYRRLLAHAFSEKGLREQEPLIKKYVDLLIDGLREKAEAGETIDIAMWYNMTSFDIIGDLAFGESFGSLENRKEHDWIPALSGSAKFVQIFAILRHYGAEFLYPYIVPQKVRQLRAAHLKRTEDKVNRRIEYGEERGDFWDRIVIKSANDNESGEGMTRDEMFNNASALVLAGSVTTSLTLAGT
jgi:cytochrome P450